MEFSLKNFSGLLLDFDGTLADTEPLHTRALKAFFATKGIAFGSKEPGKSTLHVFRDWGKEFGRAAEAKGYLAEYLHFLPGFFTEHRTEINWQPDVLNFLEKISAMPQVLATGSFTDWLTALDPHLQIFAKFPLLVTKEEVLPDHEKPDPLAYILAAEKLGLPPQACLALEDSRVGILSAKNAGCFVVAINRGTTEGFEVADKIIDTLSELLTV